MRISDWSSDVCSSDLLQDTASRLPGERLLIETDAPFLAPVPKRGKHCEPAFVTHTARFLAELRREGVEALCQGTAENFYRLFGSTEERRGGKGGVSTGRSRGSWDGEKKKKTTH